MFARGMWLLCQNVNAPVTFDHGWVRFVGDKIHVSRIMDSVYEKHEVIHYQGTGHTLCTRCKVLKRGCLKNQGESQVTTLPLFLSFTQQ